MRVYSTRTRRASQLSWKDAGSGKLVDRYSSGPLVERECKSDRGYGYEHEHEHGYGYGYEHEHEHEYEYEYGTGTSTVPVRVDP